MNSAPLPPRPRAEAATGNLRRGACLALLAGFAALPVETGAAEIVARSGMVVTVQRLASEIGVDVLRHGGNAVDAAVAVGYALAVVYPAAGNIGGGGFMTIRFADGRSVFLDFREHAPLAATETLYQDASGAVVPGLSTDGYLSVGVPGTVLGLETARERWGTRPRAELLAPAIRLASTGFVLTEGDLALFRDAADALKADRTAALIFLKDGKVPFAAGDLLKQPDLAATLSLIAEHGADAFYTGPIADAIVAASRRGHGILQKADFERYRVRELAPVECRYRGYTVTSAPPPSSGGTTLCEMLNILEGYKVSDWAPNSAESVHYLVEAMRHAYADRNTELGDPDFIRNPVVHLIDKDYAGEIRRSLAPDRAGSSASAGTVPREGNRTTHYSVVDAAGTAVAVTYTLNDWFGAKVVAGGTGILLNDEMDDFTAKPGVPNQDGLVTGAANAIRPLKTPLSSMTPTIVSRDGRTVLVLGSEGGPRIITQVLQVIVNVIDHGMSIGAAVDAPRIHHQFLPDAIAAEPGALSAETRRQLQRMGYRRIVEEPEWGMAECIMVGGDLKGANDRRAVAGAAIGY